MKALTHDVLYETYRTEKLSRTVHSDTQYVIVRVILDAHSHSDRVGIRPFYPKS